MVVPKQSGEVYDHGKDIAEFHKVCEDFKNSLKKDPRIHNDYTVTSKLYSRSKSTMYLAWKCLVGFEGS